MDKSTFLFSLPCFSPLQRQRSTWLLLRVPLKDLRETCPEHDHPSLGRKSRLFPSLHLWPTYLLPTYLSTYQLSSSIPLNNSRKKHTAIQRVRLTWCSQTKLIAIDYARLWGWPLHPLYARNPLVSHPLSSLSLADEPLHSWQNLLAAMGCVICLWIWGRAAGELISWCPRRFEACSGS